MADAARIARNTTYLTVASIVQKVISFGYFAFLATALGADQLGQYSAALKFTSVFVIFMDFGLGPLLTREVAKDESRLQENFEKFLSIKAALIVLSLAALVGSAQIWNTAFETVTAADVRLIYVGAFIIVFDTLTFTLFSIFRALKQLLWEAIGIVIYQSAILLAGFGALHFGLPLPYVLGALLLASAVQFVYMLGVLFKKTSVKIRWNWNWKTVWQIISLAAPFAFAGILFRLNGTADSLMLKSMIGDRVTGWYELAFKLTFALTVLPGAFATSYFPVVSTYYQQAREKLSGTFETGVVYMLILSLPITVAVFVLGDDIVLRVWGTDFEASIETLSILMVALPFIFLNYPVGNFLNAVDKQKLNTFNMFIALLVNIVLNLALIPYYTFNGAAWAAVASSVVLVVLGLPWVYRVAPFRIGFLLKKLALISGSAGIMGFILFFIQDNYSLLLLIPIGAIIYVVGLLLLGALTSEELSLFKRALLKRT
ncbi:MAG: hypothetical protein CO132_04810 [Candidatus Kerfeldbacteria bacterium CG_4_9_14_3_um_filter_45_8]|nr:MAG: hypothetical protein CO132_04810 [Candidatus Kerfeldbacteria bacterium CG_4_9_14_3_um_filter_45_8]